MPAPDDAPPPGGEPRPTATANALTIITAVGSPLAVGVALLFYFGWRRSQAQAVAFGADVSVFEMSTEDYVLRSIAAVFWPGVLLLVTALFGIWLHRRLVAAPAPPAPPVPPPPDGPDPPPAPPPRWRRWLRAGQRVWAGRVAWVLLRSWAAFLAVAVILLIAAGESGEVVLPFWIGLAIAGPAYGAFLRRRLTGDPTTVSRPVAVLVAALLLIALAWQIERFAAVGGTSAAEAIKDDPTRLPTPTVYSVKRLHIEAPGVTETEFAGPEESYHFRYDGLYLLQRSGGKYFLISGGWHDGGGRLVILPDDESLRLDFTAPARR